MQSATPALETMAFALEKASRPTGETIDGVRVVPAVKLDDEETVRRWMSDVIHDTSDKRYDIIRQKLDATPSMTLLTRYRRQVLRMARNIADGRPLRWRP